MKTTLTADTDTHKKRRAELQGRLRARDKYKVALDQAAQALAEAERLVADHQRTPGYLESFQRAFATHAAAFNDLDNAIPNQLRNSCQDRRLKDQFEVALSIRTEALQAARAARQSLKRAEADLASTQARIAQQRGEAVLLQEGEELPWGEGAIRRVFGSLKTALGAVESPTWAIAADRQEIHFAPGVHPRDAEFYQGEWADSLRAIRMARAAAESAEGRLAAAEADLAEIKDKMIWSPV